MASGLIATLFHDEFAVIEAEKQALVQQQAELVQQKDELVQQQAELVQQKDELVQQKDELVQQKDELVQSFQQALHQMLVARYPAAPAALFDQIAHVSAAHQLQQLLDTILTAPDLEHIQQVLEVVAPTT